MVLRISVAWITSRASSARVRSSRSKPSTRDHRPMYIEGAYCACRPAICSSISGSGTSARSRSPWRARRARLSARGKGASGMPRRMMPRRCLRGLLHRGGRAGARLEPCDELVEPQLLEALGDGVELARAELDELPALLAELERLAQAGLAGVEAADDLFDTGAG